MTNTFIRHTMEYYDWYDIQSYIHSQTQLPNDDIDYQIIGDYDNDSYIGIDFDYRITRIRKEHVTMIPVLEKLKDMLGNDITVNISW